VEVSEKGNLLEIRFRASHFLRYMVRRLTAALVRAGTGRLSVDQLRKHLSGESFPFCAPSHGLTLERVLL